MDSCNIIKKEKLKLYANKNLALKLLCYNDIEIPDIEGLNTNDCRYIMAIFRLFNKHKELNKTILIKDFIKLIPDKKNIFKDIKIPLKAKSRKKKIKRIKQVRKIKSTDKFRKKNIDLINKFRKKKEKWINSLDKPSRLIYDLNKLNEKIGYLFSVNKNKDYLTINLISELNDKNQELNLFIKPKDFYFNIPYNLFEILTTAVKKHKEKIYMTSGLFKLALHFLLRSSTDNDTEEITESTSVKDYAKKLNLSIERKAISENCFNVKTYLQILKDIGWIDFEAKVFKKAGFSYKNKIYIKVKPKQEIFNEDSSTKKKSN